MTVSVRLTHPQRRMWFLHAMEPRRTDLTIACAARLNEPMAVAELQRRLGTAVRAHPMLSVNVTERDGRPEWLAVDAEDAVRNALSPAIRADGMDHLRLLYTRFAGRPWDLGRDVPWSVQLVSVGEDTWLFCRFHHLICDGDRSIRLFLDALAGETGSPVDLDRLLAEPQPQPEPQPEPQPDTDRGEGAITDLTEQITELGDVRERITETARDGVARWSGLCDETGEPSGREAGPLLLERLRAATAPLTDRQLLVAVPFDGCAGPQEDQIGYFGNPGLALLPADPAEGWPEHEYERAARLAAVPFQQVMADPRFRSLAPVENPFDILLVPRSLFAYRSSLVRSVTEPVASRTPYALTVNHWRDDQGALRFSVESPVFEEPVLEFLGRRMRTAAAGEPSTPAPAPASGARLPAPDVADVIQRVADVVAEHGGEPALETPGGRQISYRELWASASRLARLLTDHLHDGRRTVAIAGDKHPNEIACVLGTHLAGGTTLRLDRDPDATRRALSDIPGIAAVIHLDDEHTADPPEAARQAPPQDGPFGPYRLVLADGPETPEAGSSPAFYITLTSGSTGEPKPIPYPRREFSSLIDWHLRTMPGKRRMLQFSRISFDVAYHVIYATLCGGGTLVLADRAIREDPRALLEYLATARIEKLYLPTVLLQPIAETAVAGDRPMPAPVLREVFVAGGSLEITDEIRAWFEHTGAHLLNHYGMSETQDVTSHLLAGPPADWPRHPAAGLPVDGVEIRIVGGRGLELPSSLSGSVVVRTPEGETTTGDVGYRDRDGLLHILGRADRVIKRRGFRVNLHALEAEVAGTAGIAEAVAVTYATAQDPASIAVIATAREGGGPVDAADTAERIAATLGDGYEFELRLVPEIPRLANAKPDLVRLAAIAQQAHDEARAGAPAGEDPEGSVVLEAVRDLVGDPAVDERARFLDAGLDSISLMTLAARLRPVYPRVSIVDFFQHPTIGDLQRALDRAAPGDASAGPGRTRAGSQAVAVVGMAGRFPGAPDVDTLWAKLLAGGSGLTTTGPRTGAGNGPATFVPVNGALADADQFDHRFFGMTPAEARRTDPQIRAFLQLCWAALEDAGEAASVADKNVGVFAGCGLSTYLINEIEPERQATDPSPFLEHNTLTERLGNDRNYLSSTVSYRLGLTGPSVVVQAACSTSLAAVHMARQALLNGECDVAIAGGVSIISPQPDGYEYVEGSVRSRSGECRPFDRDADGTVFGDGAAVVVLKRAEDAKADRNTAYADLIGSAVNHDGAVKANFSAPNPAAQTAVINAALRSVGRPVPLDFVEAHGTGTAVGDAIEWQALAASEVTAAEHAGRRCVVGSVKSNVGHLDEAAGVTGLIKACLAVRDRVYPGTRGFSSLNPQLTDDDRFTVSAGDTALPGEDRVHAGVSSFGMGGANCHVVLSSPDPAPREEAETVAGRTAPLYLPVSARSADSLTATSDLLIGHLGDHAGSLRAADVVRTLSSGRSHFTEHRGVICHDPATCGQDLAAAARLHTPVTPPERGRGSDDRPLQMVWAFPGQGSGFSWDAVNELGHWPAFSRTFRTTLQEFEELLGPRVFQAHVGRWTGEPGTLIEVPSEGDCAGSCTVREQVLQFSFQFALARLLGSFGIVPDAVVGHSLGEIAAAACAGRISEGSALALVAERARLMESAPAGFMAQLSCSAEEAAAIAEPLGLDIAAINGPRQTVVAGGRALETLTREAEHNGIGVTPLKVGKAFHSRLMSKAAERLTPPDLGPVSRRASVEFVSSHARRAEGRGPEDPAYWTSQLTSPVDYVAACRDLLARGDRIAFVELGVKSVLSNLLRAVASDDGAAPPALVRDMRESVSQYVGRVIAAAYQADAPLDWSAINQVPDGALCPLPTYRFAPTTVRPYRSTVSTAQPNASAKPVEANADADARTLTSELSPDHDQWILQHQVDGRYVAPAAGIVVLLAKAAQALGLAGPVVSLSDIAFERPVVFESRSQRLEARVSAGAGPPHELALSVRPAGNQDGDQDGDWVRAASAVLETAVPCSTFTPGGFEPAGRPMAVDELYRRFESQRLAYGPAYQGLRELTADGTAVTAAWETGAGTGDQAGVGVELDVAAAIDGIFQAADVLGADSEVIRMPAYLAGARLRLDGPLSRTQRVRASESGDGTASGALRDDRTGVLAELTGIRFQAAPPVTAIAHTLRWHERVAVGADLPTETASEIEGISRWLSAPDPEVTEYQRQLWRLENQALLTLRDSRAADYVRSHDVSDPVAVRRARALADLLERPIPDGETPAETAGDKVTTEQSILRHCAGSLDAYFGGDLDGEAVLFSGDGPELLRRYYQSSFVLDRMNEALNRVVRSAGKAAAGGPLKILEVGGGTGASADGVLRTLTDNEIAFDYTFTDLSEGLVRLSRRRFEHHPGFRASIVDLDSDASVGALDDDYDLVIAVDVVHATKDVGRTMDRLRGRLRPTGMVLLVEDLRPLAWVDLTFGLLDGWWSFDDPIRPAHPLLPAERWRALLSERFSHVELLRACGGLPLEELAADEGLFVCAAPRQDRRSDRDGTVLVRTTSRETSGDLIGRIGAELDSAAPEPATLILDHDDDGVAAGPDQAERWADTLLRVVRAAEERPSLRDLVIRTTGVVTEDGPVPLTAGSMAAALARVADSEGRRVNVVSLAADEPADHDTVAEQVATFQRYRRDQVNGVIAGGRLYLPRLVPADSDADSADGGDAVGPADHDAAVLFGGESGIAQAVTGWLLRGGGVRRVYLVGRSAPREPTVEFLDAMRADGADVRYRIADVGELSEVRAIAREVSEDSARPLVLNLGAVLKDATIDGAADDDVAAVLRPKVRGSHNIEAAFGGQDATVVLFSSTSVLLGNAGQAAHAMACAYLDGLAAARPAEPAPRTVSVQWGPWADVGITARLGLNERLRRSGEIPLAPAVLLPELGRAIRSGAGTVVAADLSSAALRRRPFLAGLLPALPPPATAGHGADGAATREAEPPATNGTTGGDLVQRVVANVLGVAPGEVDPGLDLTENGVDSLNLIEVRSLIERESGVRVPLNELSDAVSLEAIRDIITPSRSAADRTFFYVAGIFGHADGAPDLEQALDGTATLLTLASPTRPVGAAGRLDVVEVAKDLADEVERAQPTGPVTVAGHSFGAMLAYSVAVELRHRGRHLERLVLIDGEPVGSLAISPVEATADTAEQEFTALLNLSSERPLTGGSRAQAFDDYRANCEIARSTQVIDELECPIVIVLPDHHIGVGIAPPRVPEIRQTALDKIGGTSVDIVNVPGDHFTMLRSPNVEQLITHIGITNP
ncbi:beta-ketoacyl synthase N-terminal-like domain-containing protein [Actinomadura fulvescens]|uniref:Uncharacterized protein n=1 Tax=Actinomadura fulvescens TaxID=46160 RepID=A0ABN3PH76_9ACTN